MTLRLFSNFFRSCRRGTIVGGIALFAVLDVRGDARADVPIAPEGISGTYGDVGVQAAVDEGSGAMTYSVPFELPAARGDAQPSLGIHYRSGSGTQEAGEDWSLGLPTIERAPMSNWPKYADNGIPSDEDRYTFSGQPLTFVCTVGGTPSCPSSAGPMPAWANGHRHYRLQIDRTGARFFLEPNRLRWLVQFRGGQIMELGEPLTASNLTSTAGDAVDRTPLGANKIFRWNISRQYDLHGIEEAAENGTLGNARNLIVYQWRQVSVVPDRVYLTDIFYTPPANGYRELGDFAYHVQLSWDGPNHPALAAQVYAPVERRRPQQRLRRVAIAAKPWREGGERQVVRTYNLNYYAQRSLDDVTSNPGMAPLWNKWFLKEVEQAGQCGEVESQGFIIPTSCPVLPPVTFDYENAKIATGVAVETSAPALKYAGNTAVMDVDRDGLPDIVQGWPQNVQVDSHTAASYNVCKGNDGSVVRRYTAIKSISGGDVRLLCEGGAEPVDLGSARAQVAYVNMGISSTGALALVHRCLDAGAGYDPGAVSASDSLTYWQTLHGPSFAALFSQFGAEVMGPWGDGLFLWSQAENNGFTIEPTSKDLGAFCPEAVASGGFTYPALRWRQTSDSYWAKKPSWPATGGTFIDIDGDGLPDRLSIHPETVTSGDYTFKKTSVNVTRRISHLEEADGVHGPALVPFTLSPPGVEYSALGPAGQSWYADMNGDGLVDLVTFGSLRSLDVRPGNGRGHFGCNPSEVSCTPAAAPWLGGAYPLPLSQHLSPFATLYSWWGSGVPSPPILLLHDVTGDGLADLVVVDWVGGTTPRIRLWVNTNGRNLTCANPSNDCTVATFAGVGPVNAPLSLNVSFADVDGNGADDLVLLGFQKVWHFSFITTPPVPASGARAPRPGLLTHIRNGTGADTEIVYQMIQELDLQASQYSTSDDSFRKPWDTHLPVVLPVVTSITTRDTPTALGAPLAAPYGFRRTITFEYRDPAYDLWARSFKGFKRVRSTRSSGETVETWYWFGPCEEGRVESPSGSHAPMCSGTSDDPNSPDASMRALVGLPVRVDRYVPGIGAERATQWLSTTLFAYDSAAIQPPPPAADIPSRRAMLGRVHEYLYDTASPVSRNDPAAPAQPGKRVHIQTTTYFDDDGIATKVENEGRQADSAPLGSTLSDSVISRVSLPEVGRRCGKDWRCQPTGTELRERRGLIETRLRNERFERNAAGEITHVYSVLEYPSGTPVVLNREHVPATASTKVHEQLIGEIERDVFGTPKRILGAPGPNRPCTEYTVDPVYAQFPATVGTYTGGNCTGKQLWQEFAYDRGLQSVTAVIVPERGTLETREYDAFGRLAAIYSPHPEEPFATIETVKIGHYVQSPTPFVTVDRFYYSPQADPKVETSYEIFNGLGEHVLGFDHVGTASYGEPWIMRDWTERDDDGRVYAQVRPSSFDGNPLDVAMHATPLNPNATKVEVYHDPFGRPLFTYDNGLTVAEHRYLPLEVETRDAEQAKASGLYAGNVTRMRHDGHGRLVESEQRLGDETLIQSVGLLGTGEVGSITRKRPKDAAPLYERTLQWDSFGRMVRNLEPNTSAVGVGWSYVYDDDGHVVGTSDARGCGKNIYYDALGRTLAEDFVPCSDAQMPYTPPDLTTGDGTEKFYRYDSYEPGQVHPESGFEDREEWAVGRLVSVRDRGAYTQYNYDARGRLRRTARRMARPGAASPTLADRFASHAFQEGLTYDDSDRLRKRITSLQSPELVVNGESAETFEYDGVALTSIGSSYGALVQRFRYMPNHSLRHVTYGDAASTEINFTYDERDRLDQLHVFRHSTPPMWWSPTGRYTAPGPETTQLELSLNYFTYDDVGNPTSITDESTATWPTGARQVSRVMQYDAAYRLKRVEYIHGKDRQVPVFLAEGLAGDRRPVGEGRGDLRVGVQTFEYDVLGNTKRTQDDEDLNYDRSLGTITNGTATGPNQLKDGNGVHAEYDAAGNMTELTVSRVICGPVTARCSHRFVYDWDEVGQLARARRWDYAEGAVPPLDPSTPPDWDLTYAYSEGNRVRTSSKDASGEELHTLDVFGSLRISRAGFDAGPDFGDYNIKLHNEFRLLAGGGRAFYDVYETMPIGRADGKPVHVFLSLGDHLGSTGFVIDKDSGEVVERVTYQAFGAIESDYRPERWAASRAEFKFTGKEEDIEVGLTYFGARYYQAHLGRWISADPLAVHGLGADLNPYAYVGGRVMSHVDVFGLEAEPIQEVCVCKNGKKLDTWQMNHASDMASGPWWREDRYSGPQTQTPRTQVPSAPVPSAPSGAFNSQIARIGTKLGRAFGNAGKDSLLGWFLRSSFLARLADQLGLFDSLKTPASERDAEYYAASAGIMTLGIMAGGPEVGGPGAEATAAEGGAAIEEGAFSKIAQFSERNLQKGFTKHGTDFGLTGNWNPARGADFSRAVNVHLNSPTVVEIAGTYRGAPVTHFYNPATGVNVMINPAGQYVSGWQLGAGQLETILRYGGLQ